MKTNQYQLLFSLIILFVMASCGSGPCECADCYANVDKAAIEAEIQTLTAMMVDDIVSQDIPGFLDYYTDDLVSYPPGRPAQAGKTAVKADLEAMWGESNPPGMSFEFERSGIWILGDHVVETGTFSYDTDEMEEPSLGKYMNLYRKDEDGKYRCLRDIWNYDSMPDPEDMHEEEVEEESVEE